MMHAAVMERSERLKRVRALLADGAEHSTLDIAMGARVCAVSAVISELRANGLTIVCRQTLDADRNRIWVYRLVSPTTK